LSEQLYGRGLGWGTRTTICLVKCWAYFVGSGGRKLGKFVQSIEKIVKAEAKNYI
jgi:hypothetical protein